MPTVIRDENQVFKEWRQAEGSKRDGLLAELVKLLERHAYAICATKLRERRHDIVNYAVYKAISKAEGFKGEAKFSTWFHEIVLNLCNSSLRNKRFRSVERQMDETFDIEGQEGVSTAKLELERIMSTLDQREQALMEMKKEGMADTEIGEILGIDENAVRQRWYRLREKIVRGEG